MLSLTSYSLHGSRGETLGHELQHSYLMAAVRDLIGGCE